MGAAEAGTPSPKRVAVPAPDEDDSDKGSPLIKFARQHDAHRAKARAAGSAKSRKRGRRVVDSSDDEEGGGGAGGDDDAPKAPRTAQAAAPPPRRVAMDCSPVVAPRRTVVMAMDSDEEEDQHTITIADPVPELELEPPAGQETVVVMESEEEEEEEEEDDEDEDNEGDEDAVMRECTRISDRLRSSLAAAGGPQGGAEGGGGHAEVVRQDDISRVCGDTLAPLKPYQLVGVNFLMLLHQSGVGGAILADEMGLGKTVQAISFLGLLREQSQKEGGGRPHLVIVPASVLDNWMNEFRQWAPLLRVKLFHGEARREARDELRDWQKASSRLRGIGMAEPPFDVLLVCYTLFERDNADQKEDRGLLRKFDWGHIVMDEAHMLKNRNSTRASKLRSVVNKCRHRLMLTGTPLQNDLGELQNLLEFLMPSLFAESDVPRPDAEGEEEKTLVAKMKHVLEPFVLRRLKSDVMSQLATKLQVVEKLDMVPQQTAAYADAVRRARKEAAGAEGATDGEEGAGGKEKEKEKDSQGGTVAEAKAVVRAAARKNLPQSKIEHLFTHLRKVANHPLLVRRHFSDDKVAKIARAAHRRCLFGDTATEARVKEELMGYSDFHLHSFCLEHKGNLKSHVLKDKHAMASAKCKHLAKLLPKLKSDGHRVLLFSQWTTMLDVLEWALDCMGYGGQYCRLDGSTQVADRQGLVNQFNAEGSELFIFLLSTRAGGQGLNLTGADTVVLHDVDFNPQIDRQAEDRCHRIGQTKPVTVHRLVCTGTVDENILAIAQRKLSLDAAVLGEEGGGDGSKAEDRRNMSAILRGLLDGEGFRGSAQVEEGEGTDGEGSDREE